MYWTIVVVVWLIRVEYCCNYFCWWICMNILPKAKLHKRSIQFAFFGGKYACNTIERSCHRCWSYIEIGNVWRWLRLLSNMYNVLQLCELPFCSAWWCRFMRQAFSGAVEVSPRSFLGRVVCQLFMFVQVLSFTFTEPFLRDWVEIYTLELFI